MPVVPIAWLVLADDPDEALDIDFVAWVQVRKLRPGLGGKIEQALIDAYFKVRRIIVRKAVSHARGVVAGYRWLEEHAGVGPPQERQVCHHRLLRAFKGCGDPRHGSKPSLVLAHGKARSSMNKGIRLVALQERGKLCLFEDR